MLLCLVLLKHFQEIIQAQRASRAPLILPKLMAERPKGLGWLKGQMTRREKLSSNFHPCLVLVSLLLGIPFLQLFFLGLQSCTYVFPSVFPVLGDRLLLTQLLAQLFDLSFKVLAVSL